MARNFRKVTFEVKWLFMSPEARYAYLWNRTKVATQRANAGR